MYVEEYDEEKNTCSIFAVNSSTQLIPAFRYVIETSNSVTRTIIIERKLINC